MCRKLLGTVLLGIVGIFVVFGFGAWSYVKTGLLGISEAVEAAVPIEFEIRRARTMLADLQPEIRKNMLTIAQEEAALERLSREIADFEVRQEKDRVEVVRLKDDLATGKSTFHYAGREYTADEVRTDLGRRFQRHRTADETLVNLRKMHAARTQSLAAARDKMNGMLTARRELELEIEQLDSRLKTVRAAETSSALCLDDGRLSRTRKLLQDLESRLTVSERIVAADGRQVGEIPLDAAVGDDIVEQVTSYFAGDGESPAARERVARR